MHFTRTLHALPGAVVRLLCMIGLRPAHPGARRARHRTAPTSRGFMPAPVIGWSCGALFVVTAAVCALLTLAASLAVPEAIGLLAAIAGAAVEPANAMFGVSLARALEASGASGVVCGLMACARFLVDLHRQGWL